MARNTFSLQMTLMSMVQRHTHGQAPSSEIQIQALREELDAANKKADRYVHLVGMLYEELDNLRRNVCHNCKKKLVPSYNHEKDASPSAGPGQARPSLWRRIVSGGQTQSPLFGSPNAGETLNKSIAEIQAKPATSANPSPNASNHVHLILPPQIQAKAIVSAPPQGSSSASPKQPPTTPVDEIKSKQPSWSVSHNPNIKRALHIDLVKTFNCTAEVSSVKFSPDGKYLAVGLDRGNGKTYIYDVEKGLNICFLADLFWKEKPAVWSIEFSPDNKYIAITTSDKRIRLWEIARKRTRAAFTFSRYASASTICFSPNGRFLVAGNGGTVRIWSVRDGTSKKLFDDVYSISSVAFSPDGRHIASVDRGGWLRIWDARTGQRLDSWKGHTNTWNVLRVAFCPDGKELVSVGEGTILRYWDVSRLSLSAMEPGRGRSMAGTPGQMFQQIRAFVGHKTTIRCVSFSPDFRCVATSSLDEGVQFWDTLTTEWQCTLHGHGDAYAGTIDFDPAGKYFAGGGGHQVRIWRYRKVERLG